MTVNTITTVWCDGVDDGVSCPEFFEGETARLAREELGRPGRGRWLVALPTGRDLCPRHAPQKAAATRYGRPDAATRAES